MILQKERDPNRLLSRVKNGTRTSMTAHRTCIFQYHPDGFVKSVNKFGAEYLGYNINDLIGKEVWKVVHPEDLFVIKQRIKEIFKKKVETRQP